MTCWASYLVSCKYRHAERSFGYKQFDVHEGVFNVRFPESLMENASFVRLANLTTFGGSDPGIILLALKQSTEVD